MAPGRWGGGMGCGGGVGPGEADGRHGGDVVPAAFEVQRDIDIAGRGGDVLGAAAGEGRTGVNWWRL
nr:hypothetical protein [Mycobacterium sp. Z3061]